MTQPQTKTNPGAPMAATKRADNAELARILDMIKAGKFAELEAEGEARRAARNARRGGEDNG